MSGITITVYGSPAPQGSKRAIVNKSGKVSVIESSKERVKSWRQAVIDELEAIDDSPRVPMTGPLTVEMMFFLKRPKGHYGSGRNAGTLKESAPRRPVKVPDLSKLVRATEDALTDAGLWADDALVVNIGAAKLWADGHLPGAVITIREWSEP